MSTADIIALVGVGVAIVGILVGVAYARRRANLVFYQEGRVTVQGNPDDEIEVLWRGASVPAFTRTHIWVWNAGSLTLDRQAMVPGFPLRFSFGEAPVQVLAASVLASSKDENRFEVIADSEIPNSVTVDFEYLDARHGALIEVLHTDGRWRTHASGTLKGCPVTLSERGERRYFHRGRREALTNLALPLAAVGYFAGYNLIVGFDPVLASLALIPLGLACWQAFVEYVRLPPMALRRAGDPKATRSS